MKKGTHILSANGGNVLLAKIDGDGLLLTERGARERSMRLSHEEVEDLKELLE